MKIWEEIVDRTKADVQKRFSVLCLSVSFGAYIAPQDYFVSYVFKTTEEYETAKGKGLFEEINAYHRECLRKNGYPEEGIKDCTFASQEECDREFHGNWYYYYK